jgi:hypothetical protein
MNPYNFNQPVKDLSNEQIFIEIKPCLFDCMKFLSLQAKEEHCKLVFDNLIGMIRKLFWDFTINDLVSTITNGTYGEYGDYIKVNPKTIMSWCTKKRFEKHAKEAQEVYSKNQESPTLFEKDGGQAILLGLALDKKGVELDFDTRLLMVKKNAIIESIGRTPKQIIHEYYKQINILQNGRWT